MTSRSGRMLSVPHLVTLCSPSVHAPYSRSSHRSGRLTTSMYMYLCKSSLPMVMSDTWKSRHCIDDSS